MTKITNSKERFLDGIHEKNIHGNNISTSSKQKKVASWKDVVVNGRKEK